MRRFKYLACCCLLPLLAACSTTRLAYDHLDTLLRWQASKYVDLNAQQRQSLDTELQNLWTWHRHTQLPLYAADLRQLAATAQAGPLSREQLEAVSAKIRGDWDRIVEQALPGYARAHVLLSDAQVADMIQRIGKEIERRSRKMLDRSEPERRERMAERMDDTLRDWIGRPNVRQRELVEQWAVQVQLATSEQTQERHSTLDRYAALLATRAQPGFEQRIRAFFLGPDVADDPQSPETVERQRWLQLLADLSATLEPAQREHLCRKLLGYAADFEALAVEPG
ncbi:MAG: hypothetical protein JWR07_3806 [Nevskia sp.]|nr:hypothetical protein [Nevskia sp.]